jgi:hypothetical protein
MPRELKCKKCGSKDIRVFEVITVSMPVGDHLNITKEVLAKESTKIWNRDELRQSFTCRTCFYSWGPFYQNMKRR